MLLLCVLNILKNPNITASFCSLILNFTDSHTLIDEAGVISVAHNVTRSTDLLQEADYPVHEQIDLYDDVISPSANNGDAPEDRDYLDTLPAPGGTEGGKSAPPNVVYTYTGKRIALYIGNLTWVGIREFCLG